LASSGFPFLDKLLGHDGYPDRSAILTVGPPGIGKEALGYKFAYSGLENGEFSAYATSLAVRGVLQDNKAFGIDTAQKVPTCVLPCGQGREDSEAGNKQI